MQQSLPLRNALLYKPLIDRGAKLASCVLPYPPALEDMVQNCLRSASGVLWSEEQVVF